MSLEDISNIIRTSYGEDLGYTSDDAEYEYYSKLRLKSTQTNPVTSSPGMHIFTYFWKVNNKSIKMELAFSL